MSWYFTNSTTSRTMSNWTNLSMAVAHRTTPACLRCTTPSGRTRRTRSLSSPAAVAGPTMRAHWSTWTRSDRTRIWSCTTTTLTWERTSKAISGRVRTASRRRSSRSSTARTSRSRSLSSASSAATPMVAASSTPESGAITMWATLRRSFSSRSSITCLGSHGPGGPAPTTIRATSARMSMPPARAYPWFIPPMAKERTGRPSGKSMRMWAQR